MTDSHGSVPMKNKILFGIGDMYAGGAFLLVGLLYLKFLTDIAGLIPTLAGTVFLIGKVWDAVSDPLMGILSDRTRSRFGRRRLYFLIGILPVGLSFALLWMKLSTDSQVAKFIYYTFSYILFNTSFTLVQVPYNAILPDMTDSYGERASMSGIRLTFSAVSAIIAGTVPMILINAGGYTLMAVSFGIFYAIPWICVFFGTYEKKTYDMHTEQESIRETFSGIGSMFQNRSFRHHAGIFICSQTAVDILTTLFIYYLTYVLGRAGEFSMVMAALLIVPVIMMPIYTKISRKYSKTTPMHIGLVIWSIALISSLFLRPGQPGFLIYLIAAFSGVGTASAVFVPWSILPDITDVDELITGKRREGLYSGIATLLRKIAQAISVFLIGVLLDVIGYVPNVEQTPGTIWGLKVLFGIMPVLFILTALYFSYKYAVTEENHGIVMAEIRRRKERPESSPDHKTIAVCRKVTGLDVFAGDQNLPS